MQLTIGKEYTIQQIIANAALPVRIKKSSWSPDFEFLIERTDGQRVYGTALKNGVEHKRRFGDYSYTLSEQAVFLGVPEDLHKKQEEERRRKEQEETRRKAQLENERELIGTQIESEEELSKVEISDIIRIDGSLSEKKFLSDVLESDIQKQVKEEEQGELERILQVIRRMIAQKRLDRTNPEKPKWFDAETGPRGILGGEAMKEYLAEGDRNAFIDETIDDLKKSERKPYFYHILLEFSDGEAPEHIFIGERLVYEKKWPTVISWRSPLGGLAYEKDKLKVKINNRVEALVRFRREVTIDNGRLLNAVETYNRERALTSRQEQLVYDAFLLELLREKRKQRELTNIIPSIQRNQYQIIKAPAGENLIVQGCAGSGKTMILLHRISYLLFNEKQFRPQDYLVISPSVQFNNYIQNLVKDLDLTKIKVKALPEYYVDYLSEVSAGWRELSGDRRLFSNAAVPAEYVSYLYSPEYMQALKERVPARVQALRDNEERILELAEKRKERRNQNLGVADINSEIETLKRQRRISIFDNEFLDLIPETVKPGRRKIPNCKAELYATALLNYYCYGGKKQFPLIFIDEGQDLASCEYELLRSLNSRAVMDIYGDIDQRINDYSISSWDALKTIGSFSRYSINENYRNTMQIAEFVNEELMKDMTVLGLEGPEVEQVSLMKLAEERRAFPKDRKAVIYKDARLVTNIRDKLEGFEVMSVNEAKGMEFETVFVVMNGLTDNEWYVASTRALNKLYLLDAGEFVKKKD